MLLLMSPFNPFAAACQAQDSAKVILQTALMEGAPSTGSPSAEGGKQHATGHFIGTFRPPHELREALSASVSAFS